MLIHILTITCKIFFLPVCAHSLDSNFKLLDFSWILKQKFWGKLRLKFFTQVALTKKRNFWKLAVELKMICKAPKRKSNSKFEHSISKIWQVTAIYVGLGLKKSCNLKIFKLSNSIFWPWTRSWLYFCLGQSQ